MLRRVQLSRLSKKKNNHDHHNERDNVCHVDVRSLLAQTRMTDLEILVSLHNIDVLCVSETWMSHNRAPTSASTHLPGFIVAARCDRPDRSGGGVES